MNHKRKPTKQQWILFSVSILMIIYMWYSKDTAALAQVEARDAIPMAATSLLVSLLKVGMLSFLVAAGKYLIHKFLKKK